MKKVRFYEGPQTNQSYMFVVTRPYLITDHSSGNISAVEALEPSTIDESTLTPHSNTKEIVSSIRLLADLFGRTAIDYLLDIDI